MGCRPDATCIACKENIGSGETATGGECENSEGLPYSRGPIPLAPGGGTAQVATDTLEELGFVRGLGASGGGGGL